MAIESTTAHLLCSVQWNCRRRDLRRSAVVVVANGVVLRDLSDKNPDPGVWGGVDPR